MAIQPETQAIFSNKAAEQLCNLLRVDHRSLDWVDGLKPVEWQALVTNAISFGMGAICYQKLKELGQIDKLPYDTYLKLRSDFLTSSAMSVLREREIEEIVQKINAAGVPVILLKGAHLAEEIYPDPALRQMTDLDLLVPREDIERTKEILLRLGYLPVKSFWIDFETSVSHQLPIFVQDKHLPIELHWTILLPTLPYAVDVDGLWNRARTYFFSNTERSGLSPEDLILHLSIHAALQHKLTGGLRMIYDIAVTLSHFENEINWDILVNRAGLWRAESPLFLILLLTQNLFGGNIPEDYLQVIKPDDYKKQWNDTARDLLLFNQQEHPFFSRNLATLLEEKDLRKKIGIALRRIFLSPDSMAEIYPVRPNSPRLWLYYPLHIKNLIMKHYHALLNYWKHDHSTIDSLLISHLLKEREDYLDAQFIRDSEYKDVKKVQT
jgi:hypothetical protein